jgi:hypothetical protein
MSAAARRAALALASPTGRAPAAALGGLWQQALALGLPEPAIRRAAALTGSLAPDPADPQPAHDPTLRAEALALPLDAYARALAEAARAAGLPDPLAALGEPAAGAEP